MSRIVVGIDGSAGSGRALDWAAAEARDRGASLTLVSVWTPPAFMYSGTAFGMLQPDVATGFRELAESSLSQTCEEHAADLAGLEVERRVVEDSPAAALVEAAKDADLLVVGTRGHGGFAGLVLGSVSHQCALHAPCPLVIVPPPRA